MLIQWMILYNVAAFSAVYSSGSTMPLAFSPLPGVGYRRSDIELTIKLLWTACLIFL